MIGGDRCPGCGALYSMVGRVHRCRVAAPMERAVEVRGRPVMADGGSGGGGGSRPAPVPDKDALPSRIEGLGPNDESKAGVASGSPEPSTKPFDRAAYHRAYMKEYMRRRRAEAAKKGRVE
jgi:hypothetical protein